jgi:uncharacterized membrane protein YeaQ/YmgE (transglycosylase-associated protein family)
MGILLWIVFGAIAGWIASMIMRSENGLVCDILLGIVGSVIGGFVMSLFGQPSVTGFNLYSFFVAVLGAVVLIWIGRRLHIGYH